MKERLLQLLEMEQLTSSKFADLIGVQRSSISHILSGRNKPSYDFLYKTLESFPGLNAAWLMQGKGPMYEQMGRTELTEQADPQVDLFQAHTGSGASQKETAEPAEEEWPIPEPEADDLQPSRAGSILSERGSSTLKEDDSLVIGGKVMEKAKVNRIILLYDDQSYASFKAE